MPKIKTSPTAINAIRSQRSASIWRSTIQFGVGSEVLPTQNRRSASLGRSLRRALDRLLDDRQVDDRRCDAEGDRQPPHRVIGAEVVEHETAEPDAEETADLVTEEGKAEQHGEPARAEHQGH